MPDKIQLPEQSRGGGTGDVSHNSDGNPNLFNANRNDGSYLNAYYDKPDNRWNRDNGFAFAISQLSSFLLYFMVGEFCFASWPFQPPSMRPTSLSLSAISRYFLLSKDFVSHNNIRNIFTVSVFLMASLM